MKGGDEYKGEGRVYARAMLGIGWAMGMMGMMVMIRKRVNNGDD